MRWIAFGDFQIVVTVELNNTAAISSMAFFLGLTRIFYVDYYREVPLKRWAKGIAGVSIMLGSIQRCWNDEEQKRRLLDSLAIIYAMLRDSDWNKNNSEIKGNEILMKKLMAQFGYLVFLGLLEGLRPQ